MNEREYALMRQVEDAHWWYATLRQSVAAELKARLTGRTDVRILDAGCGTGGMMEVLRRQNPSWQLTGLDVAAQAVELTRERGFTDVTEGSVNALPYPEASFDAVLSLDVLYFQGVNEAQATAEIHRVLKPGGVLVLNLPAFPLLRGKHDLAVSGVSRYTQSQVQKLLKQGSMQIVHMHCWNLWLFLPILCWRVASRVGKRGRAAARSDLFMPPAFANRALTFLARADAAVCRAIHSPLGTSVYAVARKNPDVPLVSHQR